jgi:hypothetical protein
MSSGCKPFVRPICEAIIAKATNTFLQPRPVLLLTAARTHPVSTASIVLIVGATYVHGVEGDAITRETTDTGAK